MKSLISKISVLFLPLIIVIYAFVPCFGNNILGAKKLNIYNNPFKYSSYYIDMESDMCYLKARYYSSELMRFISRDTYDLANKYQYGDGDPVSMIDPEGNFAITLALSVIIGLGVDMTTGESNKNIIINAIANADLTGLIQTGLTLSEIAVAETFEQAVFQAGLAYAWKSLQFASGAGESYGYYKKFSRKEVLSLKELLEEKGLGRWEGTKMLSEQEALDAYEVFNKSSSSLGQPYTCSAVSRLGAATDNEISYDQLLSILGDRETTIYHGSKAWKMRKGTTEAFAKELGYEKYSISESDLYDFDKSLNTPGKPMFLRYDGHIEYKTRSGKFTSHYFNSKTGKYGMRFNRKQYNKKNIISIYSKEPVKPKAPVQKGFFKQISFY